MKQWLYGILTSGRRHDIPFYLNQAKDILELGCGQGDVLLACAKEGSNCFGIDNDTDALKILSESLNSLPFKENVHLIEGDMVSFSISQQFDQIQIPLRTLQLLEPSQQRKCLSTCVKHLKKKGALLLHLAQWTPDDGDRIWRGIGTRESTDGGWFYMEEQLQGNQTSSILLHRVAQVDLNGQVVREWMLKHQLWDLSLTQLEDWLSTEGLTIHGTQNLGSDMLIRAQV